MSNTWTIEEPQKPRQVHRRVVVQLSVDGVNEGRWSVGHEPESYDWPHIAQLCVSAGYAPAQKGKPRCVVEGCLFTARVCTSCASCASKPCPTCEESRSALRIMSALSGEIEQQRDAATARADRLQQSVSDYERLVEQRDESLSCADELRRDAERERDASAEHARQQDERVARLVESIKVERRRADVAEKSGADARSSLKRAEEQHIESLRMQCAELATARKALEAHEAFVSAWRSWRKTAAIPYSESWESVIDAYHALPAAEGCKSDAIDEHYMTGEPRPQPNAGEDPDAPVEKSPTRGNAECIGCIALDCDDRGLPSDGEPCESRRPMPAAAPMAWAAIDALGQPSAAAVQPSPPPVSVEVHAILSAADAWERCSGQVQGAHLSKAVRDFRALRAAPQVVSASGWAYPKQLDAFLDQHNFTGEVVIVPKAAKGAGAVPVTVTWAAPGKETGK